MSNVFQICLECFSWKEWLLSQKTAQPVEPGEKPVDRKLNRSRSGLTPISTSQGSGRPTAQQVEARVDSQLNRSRVQKTFSLFQNGCSTG